MWPLYSGPSLPNRFFMRTWPCLIREVGARSQALERWLSGPDLSGQPRCGRSKNRRGTSAPFCLGSRRPPNRGPVSWPMCWNMPVPGSSLPSRPNALVERLIEAEAWVDLGFWLIGWELPDWVIHRLSCDDSRWNCAICVRGLAINWVEDVAEFQHGNPALAILGAFVQAQVQKAQGHGPSNVTVFRRKDRSDAAAISHEVER